MIGFTLSISNNKYMVTSAVQWTFITIHGVFHPKMADHRAWKIRETENA